MEEVLRDRLGREKRFKSMMAKHEKEDQAKYKKLSLNVAGLREYAFDSYGNPITVRDKPQPTDHEIIKPGFKMSKKVVPPTINDYYAEAFAKKAAAKTSMFPPPIPPSKSNPFAQGAFKDSSAIQDNNKSLDKSRSNQQLIPQSSEKKLTFKGKKKQKNIFDEHMTDTQRARS